MMKFGAKQRNSTERMHERKTMNTLRRCLTTLAAILVAASTVSAQVAPVPPLVQAPAKPPYTVTDLALEGEIQGENITFKLNFEVEVNQSDTKIPLAVGDVSCLEESIPMWSKLEKEGDKYVLKMSPGFTLFGLFSGKRSVAFKFASKPAKDGEWRRTNFGIPGASVRKLSVICDRNDLEVKFPGGLDVKRQKTKDGKTLMTAFLGATSEFQVEWKPEIKKFESELVMSCEANSLATAGVGALRCDTIFTYRVIQGSVSKLVLDIPDVNITQVLGDDIQDWRIDKADKEHPKLIVTLSRPKEDTYKLRVESEMILAKFPCKFDLPVVTPQSVLRTSGFMMVGTDSAIKLQVSKASGLTQVDQAAFPAAPLEGQLASTARAVPSRSIYAYQYASMPYTMAVSADDVVSSFTADNTMVLKYEDNDLTLDASVQIDVKDAPARELIIEVDTNQAWTVTGITGRNVSEPDTDVRDEKGARIIYIPFKQAVSGMVLVNIRMERPLKANVVSFESPLFKVRDAKAERGSLSVAAEKGIRLKTLESSGLREFHAGGTSKQVADAQQAFRFREPGWKIKLGLERTVSAVHSEVFHLVSLGEQVLYYSASITYHISGAPVQEFSVRIPKGVEAVEFTGADIEGWTRDGDVCTVRLQRKIMGDYTLLVTFDRPVSANNTEIGVGDIETVGTDSELGYIAIASSASLKLSEAKPLPASVITINRNEIPSAYAALAMDPILKAYKCVRAPHAVSVRIEPYEKEQLLSQIADYIGLRTRISKDGEIETMATYFVKNASRQHLVVTLPKGANLWTIKAIDDNGKRVDVASQQDANKRYLIPVRRPRDPNAWTRVEITYAQSLTKLGFWSTGINSLDVTAPSLPDTDAPFANWTIQVPANFSISHVDGNMTSTREQMFSGVGEAAMMAWRVLEAVFSNETTVESVLKSGWGGGAQIELSRTVNMASGAPLAVNLRVVPAWMGVRSSAAGFVGCLGVGVLVLVFAMSRRRSSFVYALAITVCIFGAAYSGAGRAVLACLLIVVALLVLWKPVYRTIAWILRLARRIVTAPFKRREKTPPAQQQEEEPPFEPDQPAAGTTQPEGKSGYIAPRLLLAMLLSCVVAIGVTAKPTQPQIPVMDVVKMTIQAPGTGKDIEQSASVSAEMEFKVDDPVMFNLLPAPNVMTDYELGSRSLEIVSRKEGYFLNIKSSGSYTIKFKFQAPVAKKDGQWTLAVPMPANLKNSAVIKLPEAGLELVSDAAVMFKVDEKKDSTVADAVFGPQAATVVWKPKVRKTKLEQAVFFCEVNSYVSLRSGVVDLVNVVKYQIAQGEIKELKVKIPEGVTVTAVRAAKLATWSFDPEKKLLTAILERPVSGDFSLVIGTQIAREGLPYAASIGALQVIEASRQRGSVALAAPENIQVRVDETKGLNPMNIEDFSKETSAVAMQDAARLRERLVVRKAFRYNQPEEVAVKAQAEKVQSEVRIVESGELSIGDERILLTTQLKFSVAKSGIFSAELEMPQEFEVETLTGKDVSHWDEVKEKEKNKPRCVVVHFSRQITDETEINLVITRSEKGVEQKILVPRVAVKDVAKHTGRLMIMGDRGVRIMVDNHTGVDIKKASDEGVKQAGVLVFDILRPGWTILLKTEVMAPAVKPEILHVVDLAEGMLQCRAFVQYRIENAGIKSFKIKSPVPGVTLTFTGKDIARAVEEDKAKGIWQVDLQTKKEDGFSMLVNYQLPYDTSQQGVKILPLLTLDTEEARGYLVVTCSGGVQVEPRGTLVGLKVDDPRNIPQAFGAGDLSGAIRCFRTVKADYVLDLSVVRHDAAKVLPASVNRFQMTSVMSPGGTLLTSVELTMNVGDLRFLKVALPGAGDRLWTVLVNGKVVVTSRDGKLYCIPLEDQQGDQATKVNLVYAGAGQSGSFSFSEKYQAPKLDKLPLKNIEWRFFALPGKDYYGFGGTMEYVKDAQETVKTFNAGYYLDMNKNASINNLAVANDKLQTGKSLIETGRPNAAKKILQQAMNYSQSDPALNEDARVQYRNLQKQQVKIGLINRRDAVRYNANIMDAQQM
ncbi:MAG: hypothetical protein C0404_09440, partial [Verrucomicrobia bacterium]|nr:hypothetical protein [Verrucomicrobiota bacterium]